MPDTRRADYRPPAIQEDDLTARFKADKAWHEEQDRKLAALLALPEVKVNAANAYVCALCGRETRLPDICVYCGPLVPFDHDYSDFDRPRRCYGGSNPQPSDPW